MTMAAVQDQTASGGEDARPGSQLLGELLVTTRRITDDDLTEALASADRLGKTAR